MKLALPNLNGTKKRDELLCVDLGGRTTKAAYLQRRNGALTLTSYAILDAPLCEKTLSPESLAEHLQGICAQLAVKPRAVALALGINDAIVRHAELPQMPIGDMRQVLKNNARTYLQQDLPGHLFDCYVIPPKAADAGAPKTEKPAAPAGPPRFRVLVAGARKQFVEDMEGAITASGLVADSIMPGLIGPVNAFEVAMPEVFAKEIVALVDIGFKHTTVSILEQGELALSRVVGIGGDKLTSGLAECLGVSYAEAEGIKVGMPHEVEAHLDTLVLPLGRELRASIDFFEHQRDKAVTAVYLSGGSARSEFIVQKLQAELMLECKTWSPLGGLQLDLPPAQAAEIEAAATHLTTALGTGYGRL
jgi:type IV pilus assembly protein PilM